MIRTIATMIAFALAGAAGRADEAVDSTGKKHRGQLVQNAEAWLFRGVDAKPVPISQFAYIRFDAALALAPQAPLMQVLNLHPQQNITGMLIRVDEKKVAFRTSWAKTISLDRQHLAGIEQARNSRIVLHEDFEAALDGWRLEGKPALDRAFGFHGKASLLLDQPNQRATLTWKPAISDGDAALYFYDSAAPGSTCATFDVIPHGVNEPIATLTIDATR